MAKLIPKYQKGTSIKNTSYKGKFTKGSQWEVVKDLKGYPSHEQGGVDIKLGKNGFSFTRNNGVIEAKHGLVLSNGSIIPDDKKNNFKYKPYTVVQDKPYTAVQDNTYVAPKVVMPLKLKKKQQFVPREQPVLKADTRTDQERKIAQKYTESVLNPSIRTQIGEVLQKPLRWIADPVKGVGDIVSVLAPNSALAKYLPNTNEETLEHRKKQLNPYISNKEKINSTINEAIPLTNWALLNTLPVEAAAGHVVKSGKNLIKSGKNLPKLEKSTLDFNIDGILKNNSDKIKNMEIIKKGNKYFKELSDPESLKRLKEFGEEYDIDLLDAYKKAEERWDYGTSIGKHDRFQVKKTDEKWFGLSTSKITDDEKLYGYFLENKFGKESKKTQDYYKKLHSDKSINYINANTPIELYDEVIWHELSHDINKTIINKSTKLQQEISNIFIKKEDLLDIEGVRKAREYTASRYPSIKTQIIDAINNNSILDIGENEINYITKPTETWAFLSTNLRQDLKNTGIIKNYNELLTPEKLEQAIKNGNTIFNRFEPYIKDKESFIKLFNKMTLTIAPAVLYLQSQNQNKNKE